MEGLEVSMGELRGKVEHRRGDLSAQASQGAVVKALLAAKAKGNIPGIHGRLGVRLPACTSAQAIVADHCDWSKWLRCMSLSAFSWQCI